VKVGERKLSGTVDQREKRPEPSSTKLSPGQGRGNGQQGMEALSLLARRRSQARDCALCEGRERSIKSLHRKSWDGFNRQDRLAKKTRKGCQDRSFEELGDSKEGIKILRWAQWRRNGRNDYLEKQRDENSAKSSEEGPCHWESPSLGGKR